MNLCCMDLLLDYCWLMSFSLCSSGNWTSKSVCDKFIRFRLHAFYLVSTKSRSSRFVPSNRHKIMSASKLLTGAPSLVIVFFSHRHLPSSRTLAALLTTRAANLYCEQLTCQSSALVLFYGSCITRFVAFCL